MTKKQPRLKSRPPALTPEVEALLRLWADEALPMKVQARRLGVTKNVVASWRQLLGVYARSDDYPCKDCGGPRVKGSGTGAYCGRCYRKRRDQRPAGYKTPQCGGSSRECPGHDDRMALYMQRAEKELPLFCRG
jgi:hypothetical protein